MRVLFAGTPAAALPTLEAVREYHDIVGVLTRPDRPQGRGRLLQGSDVAGYARAHELPLFQPERINSDFTFVEELSPDVVVIVAYGSLIGAKALGLPRHGWINLHFSLLPAYRGAAPVQRALLNGEEMTGVTTFLLDQGMDTGPIYGHATEPIQPTDTYGSLLDRLSATGAQLMVKTLANIESGQARAVIQSAENVSLAPKITRKDARIDWNRSAHLIERQVRAMNPTPGAWTTIDGSSFTVEASTTSDLELNPGEFTISKNGVFVGAGRGSLHLLQVRPAGKPSMTADAWARGLRTTPTAL